MELDLKQFELPNDCKQFQSWAEFTEWVHANQRPTNGGVCQRSAFTCANGSQHKPSQSWSLGESFESSLDLMCTGWAEGMSKAESIARPIVDKITGQIERVNVTYENEGDTIDMGQYLSNDPECFLHLENETVTSPCVSPKLISIVCNVSPSACVEASEIVSKGAHVMALIQTLEYAGCRVELSVIPWAFSEHLPWRAGFKPTAACVVTVKQFDQPLDPALAILALAHPVTSRKYGFLWLENASKEAQRKAGEGYGYPCNIKTGADISIESKVGALSLEWIEEQLKTQGIALQK